MTRPFFSFCKSNHLLFLCLHTALEAFPKILTKRFNTFRFLATGDSYVSLALSYRVSTSAIGKIVPETCAAIWNILYPQELLPPSSQQEWLNIAREFQLQWNFPMCCGCIDGKHVSIQAPPNQGSEYFNYKGFHSFILLAVCDANYCFIMFDVGDSGRHSDGGVLLNSAMGKKCNELGFPPEEFLPNFSKKVSYCLVGDAAFPLKHNLMKPFPDRGLTLEKKSLTTGKLAVCSSLH